MKSFYVSGMVTIQLMIPVKANDEDHAMKVAKGMDLSDIMAVNMSTLAGPSPEEDIDWDYAEEVDED